MYSAVGAPAGALPTEGRVPLTYNPRVYVGSSSRFDPCAHPCNLVSARGSGRQLVLGYALVIPVSKQDYITSGARLPSSISGQPSVSAASIIIYFCLSPSATKPSLVQGWAVTSRAPDVT